MSKPWYVTTPIYYVNSQPHIGHIYTTLICDVLARYHKLLGEEVYFMTGTDEHGMKIQQAAEAQGIKPREFCDRIANDFRTAFQNFKFDYDYFIRTSDDDHAEEVTKVWKILEEKGLIEMGTYEGWYCVSDEKFCTELEVEDRTDENGKTIKVSSESGHKVEWMTEENFKFKLSAFQEPLLKFYKEHPDFITPQFRQREIEKFVAKGLIDLSVSRKLASCTWGIPVPPAPSTGEERPHTIYVWLDALNNYYTASQARLKAKPGSESAWPADVHVIGKDILKFHAIYWPAFLMAADRPLPKRILAHGWWTKDGKKISKSLGNAFNPLEKAEEFGLDALKYFLVRESSFDSDGDYTDSAMINRLNGELADNLGNLFLRCTAKTLNAAQCVPTPADYTDEDKAVIAKLNDTGDAVLRLMENFDIQNALIATFDGLIKCNQYVTTMAPWNLKKQGNQERLNTVLYVMCDALRIAALLLSPVIPESSKVILDKLGIPDEERIGAKFFKFGAAKPGTKFGEGETILFKKHERPKDVPEKQKKGAPKKKKVPEADDATAMDIRVGKILSIKKHPDAEKLYVEEINVGEEEPRQIVSGLVNYYKEEELLGRLVLVWCNLKPASIRKVSSAGMVLCADNGERVELVGVPVEAQPGQRVTFPPLEGLGFTPGEVLSKKKADAIGKGMHTDENGVVHWEKYPFTLEGCGTLKTTLVSCTVR
eukprot:TRINITY_DN84629_c0_g1_i1.p1 TRINITY_DN84629_c0_g1~~TRINITY_DN84629_c0_g1_i1.p1  ORF type:complete len:710 (-),score=106.93 TRINITY_DN84629_c0_g1_i1:169-2298(-)